MGPCEVPTLPGSGAGRGGPPPSLIVPKRRRRGTLSSTQSAERSPPTLPHSAEQPRPSPAPSSAPEAGPAAARIQLDLHATGYSMYDGAGPYRQQDSVSLDELLLPPPPVPSSRGASTATLIGGPARAAYRKDPAVQQSGDWDPMSAGRSPTLSIASASSSLQQTPALTASSLESHDTASTWPPSSASFAHFSLPPAAPSPAPWPVSEFPFSAGTLGDPFGVGAAAASGPSHHAPIPTSSSSSTPASGHELQHFAMDEDEGTREAGPAEDLPDPPGSEGERPAGAPLKKKATLPPADVLRRGEDLGLSLGDFDMLDTLGTGTFGRVILVRLRVSPSRPQQTQPYYFALKVLEKNTVVRLRQIEHVNSERSTLAHVNHPFVVNLFCTFQDEANLYMLMEFVQGGELFSHLRRARRFSADVARFYVANLILVLHHLHQQDIIYRDLKPENLLIGGDGHIKVTDFGFAKYVQDRTFTLCGTPEYLAPEIITATGHGAAADWWALGVLLFELLAGYPPFFADSPLEIYEKILQGKFAVPAHIDPVAKDLIRRLLTADLTQRLGNLKNGARDVMNHPWFEGVDWAAVERKEIRAPIVPLTTVPGDASNFERFPACSLESMPGVLRAISQRKYGYQPEPGSDPYGYLFPNF
ncbi:Cytochrome c oxidase subunit 1 [Rhodotorula sphaerocarpa]